jgi:hypothetical protein
MDGEVRMYGGSGDERESLQTVDKGQGLERSFLKWMDPMQSKSADEKTHDCTALVLRQLYLGSTIK